MKPILESLAAYMIRRGANGLGDTRIILPNRRSGLFLQSHLARLSEEVSWLPEILSINELISELSGLDEATQMESVFIIYDLFVSEVEDAEGLDEFYHWGEMMLADFDEIDKYLVDADMLFSNVLDLKDIEEPLAGLDPQQILFIRQFWEGFQEGGATEEKSKFLQIWKLLPRLYHGLRKNLESTGSGYQGMRYRRVNDLIAEGSLDPIKGRIIVAGFNALNQSEKNIFSWLKQQGAEFFWDFDHAYLDDPFSEAGRFMRENVTLYPAPLELESFRGLGSEKEIRIFELPSDVLQAKTVYRILEETGRIPTESCTETALVLCDEELLMPVITSLPDQMEELNVTMGYPLKNTPLFGLMDALLRLQHNARRNRDDKEQFYHKDVLAVLLHPYIRGGGKDSVSEQTVEIMNRANMIFLGQDLFIGEPERIIFRKVEGTAEIIGYLRTVLQYLLDKLASEESLARHQLDREFIFHLMIQLNKLEILLSKRNDVTPLLFERLLRKIISGIRIPFEGEPLAGIQIMGILETRMLDFNHVVLLSMNEEIMPASHHAYSYIPYSLRKAFNMPAREDMDAIYAYYFYRLLQRAEKIDLIYNSGSEGMRTGEMSRYLHQIIYSKKIEVIRPGMEIRAVAVPPIVIRHDEDIDALLRRYMKGDDNDKYLSPSAINTFMDCSLKFYLRYLAGIGEPDEVNEEIDAAGFGTVVHETVRIIYQEIADRNNGIINRKELEDLLNGEHTAEVLKTVFLSTHFHGHRAAVIEGRNMIAYRVMQRYLQKIIQTDLGISPFRLVSAERTYVESITIAQAGAPIQIRIGGKIDRVDMIGETLRVIDYKTGDARMQFPSLESLFDRESGTRNGAAFQTLFYAWLVSKTISGKKILPGLYAMRDLYKSDFDPALVMGSHQSRTRVDSFSKLEPEYVTLLKETLSRIFDPDESFVQTETLSKCRMCDFAGICSRDQA